MFGLSLDPVENLFHYTDHRRYALALLRIYTQQHFERSNTKIHPFVSSWMTISFTIMRTGEVITL
jgi:hypothetical protein